MAALRDNPPLSLVEVPVRRPSRLRVIVAMLMLTTIGLLMAASGFASRHYTPAPTPPPGKYVPPMKTALPYVTGGPGDHC